MKGVVKYELGPQGVALMDMPEPTPAKGEIKVKVLAAGICGSDIHALHDSGGRKVNMPCILGHEFVGQICEVGEGVADYKVGEWITAAPACYSCGECDYCKKGEITLCPSRASIGTHRQGAMANYVVVPAKYAFKLPENAKTIEDKKIYALAEPLCCLVRGVYEKIDVVPGDVAVVSGPGPMGMMLVQLLKARGAYVIVTGLPIDAERLALCKELGADVSVDNFDDLKAAVYARNKYGADITVDVAAVAPSLNNCFAVIRPGGTHLQIGIFGKEIPFDFDKIFVKEAKFVASNSTAVSSWKMTMALLEAGMINLKPLMNMQVSLEDWRKGFDAVISKEKYKVVILPNGDFE